MCGIAGIVGETNGHIIEGMTACLAHRGPDGGASSAEAPWRWATGA